MEEANVVHAGALNIVLRGRHGLVCLNRFSPIGRSYLHYGEHGENEIGFCRGFVPEGGTIVDVGAHQGTHSLAFARHVGPAGRVVAFEPQRQMFQNILATAALNSLENLRAVNAAVGAEPDTVRIKKYDYTTRGHFSGMKIDAANTGEEGPLVTLDDALGEAEDVTRIDLLKIDVEGFEARVLTGARQLIARHRPVIYNELHANTPDRVRVLEELGALGYRTFLHAPFGFNAANHYGYPEDRFQGGRDHNALSVHESVVERYAPILAELKGVQ